MEQFVLGIDLGAQTAKLGVVDRNGKILDRCVVVSNEDSDFDSFADRLGKAANELIDSTGVRNQLAGVGVGAPNGNYYTGKILFAPNLTWGKGREIDFAAGISKRLGGIKVTVTNDANAAAMGEMAYGVAKGMKDFIMITLGTGVGSGIVIDGKMVYGHDGFAGELGHVCMVPGGRRCGCGNDGCLEAYASAIGVAKTAVEWLAMSNEPSLLRNVTSKLTSKDVYDAAKAGDALALRVFDFTGKMLGRALADFTAFSAPEAFIFFGGLTRSWEFLEKPIVEQMIESQLDIWKGKVKVLLSTLPDSDAAILGASALGWK